MEAARFDERAALSCRWCWGSKIRFGGRSCVGDFGNCGEKILQAVAGGGLLGRRLLARLCPRLCGGLISSFVLRFTSPAASSFANFKTFY
jgi:hypothetical protein